jgi:hypothetical protein
VNTHDEIIAVGLQVCRWRRVWVSADRNKEAVAVPVIKSIDLVGVSEVSWEDAARQAFAEASRTLRNIVEMEVLHWTANVADGKQIHEYHAHTRISFRLER